MPFPPDFLWGVATSSYQIEGGVTADGRGESIWDRFCRVPGAVINGDTGDVACDHHRLWAEDVDLIASLGIRAYRFSMAWPRLFPDGGSQLNRRGLDFYERLVDRLLERGVTPVATLYHWDLPQHLQERFGGWTARDTASRFAVYAEAAFRALGDRVPLWITLNEPWCSAILGYHQGVQAPGIRDLTSALRAAHHLLLGHGLAVDAYRGLNLGGKIGITLNLYPTYARTDAPEDAAAARSSDGYTDRWFLDPVLRGTYPADMVELYSGAGADLAFDEPGDTAAIGRSIDFLGVNYYTRRLVSAGGEPFGWTVQKPPDPGAEVTDFGWEVFPQGLVDLCSRLRREYPALPLYITENGAAFQDVIGPDGSVDDQRRIGYLRAHLAAAERAIADGTDLRGYFAWSLMDNFEWAFGYTKRFGIVYVDYPTQRRIPKSSAHWYGRVVAANGLPSE